MDHFDHGSWKVRFFSIWTGQAFSLLGSQLVHFALVWWLTLETDSATVLATASLLGALPQVFIGPLAGALVDRWNRRAVMLAADTLIAVATLGLIALAWTGLMQPWHIYLLMFIRSTGGTFHWPAMQASTPLMVPEEQLSRVQGMNQALNGGMNIVAPALGAVLVGLLPLHLVLAIDVGTALLAVLPLFFVSVPQPQKAEGEELTVAQDMVGGLRYVLSWRGLTAVLILAALLNFLSAPSYSLMPLLVTRHFGGEAAQMGTMQSALGVGLLLGGLALSAWGGFRSKLLTSMAGLLGSSIGHAMVGLAPANAFWLGVAGIFVAGFMNPIINGPFFAILQSVVDPKVQGRVLTLVMSVSGAMMPVGLAIAGPVAERYGVGTWFVLSGAIMLAGSAVGFFTPLFDDLEREEVGCEVETEPVSVLAGAPGE
jgi:DHA3 family macrolide efflux protein-like MFS transporter